MHLWQIERDSRSGRRVHRIQGAFGRALVAPLIAYTFQVLRLSAAVWEHGPEWMPIFRYDDITRWETEFGMDRERVEYNTERLGLAVADKKPLRGQYAGYVDFFVPIVVDDEVVGVLVVGPVSRGRPSAAEIVARWRTLTGREPRLSDADFAAYLPMTLSTLALDEAGLRSLERLVMRLAELMAGRGDAATAMNEVEQLREELQRARFVEDVWGGVREAVDDRSQRTSFGIGLGNHLRALGLSRVPDHVLVGFTVSRSQDRDPVEEAVSREAFQRSAALLARDTGDAAVGPVGDHGVVILSLGGGRSAHKQRKAQGLAERVSGLGRRRHGLDVYFGLAAHQPTVPLHRSYMAALTAAESALTERSRTVVMASDDKGSRRVARELRRELAQGLDLGPELLGARFDLYLESVARQCDYRLEPMRAHLQAGFERVAEGLRQSGALDAREFDALWDALDQAAERATTVAELFAAYRRALGDFVNAARTPGPARQDRSLRGALEYIQNHYDKPLSLAHVARVAGFAPNYFSELFRKREGVTFARYLKDLRIERAKQLLADTELEATRVAELSGFKYAPYFARAFRQEIGSSPLEYRASVNDPKVRRKRRS